MPCSFDVPAFGAALGSARGATPAFLGRVYRIYDLIRWPRGVAGDVRGAPLEGAMLRAIMLSMAITLVALVASAHDPEGRWDYWFLIQRNMRGASCCDRSHAHILKDED
jgi:hypothetical protein